MQLRKASKKKVKLKLQIGGSSGSGKTVGALKLAYGLVGDWNKIAVIDSENESAALYAESEIHGIGEFFHLPISDFSPETAVKAIDMCEKAGIEAIIFDSGTHVWEWCVAYNAKLAGNSYTNWALTFDKYDKFKKKMLQSPCHVIMTVRKKEEYAMEQDEKGKTKIVKKGLKEISRGEMSYEFTVVFDVAIDHLTTVSKDRTGLFIDAMPFMITSEDGEKIAKWCDTGKGVDTEALLVEVLEEIRAAESYDRLMEIYKNNVELSKVQDFIDALKDKKETFLPVTK